MLANDLSLALDPALLMQEIGLVPDPWQKEFLRSNAQQQILLCTRQAGKSTVTAVMALHHALYNTSALVLLTSPSLRQSQELIRKVKDALKVHDTTSIAFESALRLEFINGSRILSLPGSEDTVRGFSGVTLLVVDESAWVPDSLYYSVRPMLAVSNGRLVCLSTPHGKQGFFFREWHNGENWERIKITADECPRISEDFLREERRSMPINEYRQEYFCEFNETEDQVFSFDLIANSFSGEVEPLFPRGAP